jgi:hypothetical protein
MPYILFGLEKVSYSNEGTSRGVNIVTDFINALPGNSSVNTFQRAAMEAASHNQQRML